MVQLMKKRAVLADAEGAGMARSSFFRLTLSQTCQSLNSFQQRLLEQKILCNLDVFVRSKLVVSQRAYLLVLLGI